MSKHLNIAKLLSEDVLVDYCWKMIFHVHRNRMEFSPKIMLELT